MSQGIDFAEIVENRLGYFVETPRIRRKRWRVGPQQPDQQKKANNKAISHETIGTVGHD
jgi:hypothetical protein